MEIIKQVFIVLIIAIPFAIILTPRSDHEE